MLHRNSYIQFWLLALEAIHLDSFKGCDYVQWIKSITILSYKAIYIGSCSLINGHYYCTLLSIKKNLKAIMDIYAEHNCFILYSEQEAYLQNYHKLSWSAVIFLCLSDLQGHLTAMWLKEEDKKRLQIPNNKITEIINYPHFTSIWAKETCCPKGFFNSSK